MGPHGLYSEKFLDLCLRMGLREIVNPEVSISKVALTIFFKHAVQITTLDARNNWLVGSILSLPIFILGTYTKLLTYITDSLKYV